MLSLWKQIQPYSGILIVTALFIIALGMIFQPGLPVMLGLALAPYIVIAYWIRKQQIVSTK